MQIIGVNFKDRNSDAFQEKVYNYNCDISDVAVGDILIAPTSSKDGDAIVRVYAVGVDPETVAPNIRAILKTISRRADEAVDIVPTVAITEQASADLVLAGVVDATELIVIKQLPVIENQLRGVKADWETVLKETRSLPCSPKTVGTVKDIRAGMRKKFFALDDRRKEIKRLASAPIDQFEATFKECITEIFNKADQELKEKVDTVEDGLRDEKRVKIEAHYLERLESFGIDFPAFAQSGIKVGLSDTEASLIKQVDAFTERIACEVEMIKGLPLADEVLVEYKESLNAPRAITAVNARHKAMEEVREKMDITPAASAFVPPPPPEVPHIVVQTKADDEKTVMIQVTGNQRQIDNLLKFLGDSWYTFKVIG